jgi:hypothetical protein
LSQSASSNDEDFQLQCRVNASFLESLGFHIASKHAHKISISSLEYATGKRPGEYVSLFSKLYSIIAITFKYFQDKILKAVSRCDCGGWEFIYYMLILVLVRVTPFDVSLIKVSPVPCIVTSFPLLQLTKILSYINGFVAREHHSPNLDRAWVLISTM